MWFWCGVGVVLGVVAHSRSAFGFGVVLVWFWCGFGVVLGGCQICVVLDRFWAGFGVVFVWFIFVKLHVFIRIPIVL